MDKRKQEYLQLKRAIIGDSIQRKRNLERLIKLVRDEIGDRK